MTNGFVKKTQKTPPEEIALAKKIRADYIERMDDHESIRWHAFRTVES